MRANVKARVAISRCQSWRGFTLVELLVVIGIVAVLIAVLLPALGRARAQANRVVCLSNIRQLGVGILMYCNDNKGWFPTCAFPEDGSAYVQYPEDWIHWQANRNIMDSAIARYVVGGKGPETFKRILRCPADSFDGRKPIPGSAPGQGPYLYSYNMNIGMGANWKPYPAWQTGGRRLQRWRAPAKKIVLTEASQRALGPVWGWAAVLTRRHGTGRFHGSMPGDPAFGPIMGANVSAVFLDGHAEAIDQDYATNPNVQKWEAR